MADPQSVSSAPAAATDELLSRIDDLTARLSQAEEVIRAIHQGEIDAVVVDSQNGAQVYTLEGPDHPYRVLFEQMHEGTVTIDAAGTILYCNRRFADLLQRPIESVAGAQFDIFMSPFAADEFAELREAAGTGHGSGEVLLRDASGEGIPVHLSLTSITARGLAITCIVVSDLRERYRNEAIAKEEQLSRSILEQAGEAVVVIDPQGVIVRRSKSANVLSDRGLLLAHFDRAFPLETNGAPCTARQILASIANGVPMRGLEATLTAPDGRQCSVLLSAGPLWDDRKELLGSVITLTDITGRKLAEDALARSNSDLRQFAYSASHDLREPVRQLAVFSELLQQKFQQQLGEEGDYLIKHAVNSAHRVEKLLRDLLAYVQAAEAPQMPPAMVDANQVVRQVIASFESLIKESGARIECAPLPTLRMHEIHLIQLFQNLLSNALKYRGEAPPQIRVGSGGCSALCTLFVADNGIGIRPEYQNQIFGLFRRLHGGEKYSGSGIGLAICQKIVQRYGGRIWVESKPGHGAKFLFTLPGESK